MLLFCSSGAVTSDATLARHNPSLATAWQPIPPAARAPPPPAWHYRLPASPNGLWQSHKSSLPSFPCNPPSLHQSLPAPEARIIFNSGSRWSTSSLPAWVTPRLSPSQRPRSIRAPTTATRPRESPAPAESPSGAGGAGLGTREKLSTARCQLPAAAICHGTVLYAAGAEAAFPAHGTGRQAVQVPR